MKNDSTAIAALTVRYALICLLPTVGTAAVAQTVAAPTAAVPPPAPPIATASSPADDLPAPTAAVAAPVVRAVTVTGARALAAAAVADAAAQPAFGKPGSPDVIRAAVDAITRLYRKHGMPVAQVVATDLSPDGILSISVAEGVVRRIIIKGLHKTRRDLVLRAMAIRPGAVYQEDRVKQDRDRLARLGIFSDVVIAPVAPGSVSERDDDGTGSKKKGATTAGASPSDTSAGSDTANPDTAGGSGGTNAGSGGAEGGSGAGGDKSAAPPADATASPISASGTDDQAGTATPSGTAPPPTSGNDTGKAADTDIVAASPVGTDVDDLGLVDVVVRVKEERTGNVAATVGYGDDFGLTGFLDLTETDFEGEAQQVSVQWQRSPNEYLSPDGTIFTSGARQAFDVSFEQPLLAPNSVSYGVDLYNKQTVFEPYFASDEDTIRNYETRRGATVRVGRSIGDYTAVFLTARRDKVGYDPVPEDLNPPLDLLETSAATVGALGVEVIRDARNEADNPHHGYLDSLLYEQAGSFMGGNRSYSQARLDLRQYIGLSQSTTGPLIAVRLLGGASFGSDIPLSEYYWLGGYELLRGYDLYSIYGTQMVLGSVELRTPVSESVQGVVFVDSGNAFASGIPSNGLKTGVGAGLRFLSPIGPIRFDAAHGDNGIVTYVSLGQSF